MHTRTQHENNTRIAVGYTRVSTLEQASEGVSLDAQRDKLKLYCKLHGITLLDIKADEGISGSTLERPGLQAALRMLERGRADTIVVAKLDRLTRSVRDLCFLVEQYFARDRFHLLSVCGMVNTHSAAGRMQMLTLANYAQFEREIISERTREAMHHMRAQGIALGTPAYGLRYSNQLDDKGRRTMVEVPEEQAIVRRVIALHADGLGHRAIAEKLTAEGIPARRGGVWHGRVIGVILQRAGQHTPRSYKRPEKRVFVCDQDEAADHARVLHARGLSLRKIGAALRRDGYAPPRGGEWHAATVRALLTHGTDASRTSVLLRARTLRGDGRSYREIAACLTREGLLPPRGGRWHPATVADLLASG